MFRSGASLGLLTVFAAGCATSGAARGDVSVPSLSHRSLSLAAKKSVRPGGTPPLPDPVTTKQVSLAQLLAYAARHAPDLRVGRSRLALGEAEQQAAAPLLLDNPEVSLSLGPRLSGGGQGLDVELSVQQRIPIAGQRGLRVEAARRFRGRLRAELTQLEWTVHRRVHAAYRIAQVARRRRAAAVRLRAFAEQLLTIARRREAAGAISGLQVQLVKGEVAQARQAEIVAESGDRRARLSLAEVAGWPSAHLPEPQGELPAPRPLPAPKRLLEQARKHHPALRTLAASSFEARARVKLADRAAIPNPLLGISYAREGAVGGNASTIVLGTLSLPIPLWQRNQGARARTRARWAVLRTRYATLASLLRVRVARVWTAVDAAARRIAIYGSKVLPTFELNLQLLERAFEAGKIDVLQVMVARGRFLQIQRQSLDAYEDYYRAVAALEAVVGAEIGAVGPATRGVK